MTPEMFIGGLIILMMVAGVVVMMTSTGRSSSKRFNEDTTLRQDRNSGMSSDRR